MLGVQTILVHFQKKFVILFWYFYSLNLPLIITLIIKKDTFKKATNIFVLQLFCQIDCITNETLD